MLYWPYSTESVLLGHTAVLYGHTTVLHESCDSYSTASHMACTVAAVSHVTHAALPATWPCTATAVLSKQDLGEPSNLPLLQLRGWQAVPFIDRMVGTRHLSTMNIYSFSTHSNYL